MVNLVSFRTYNGMAGDSQQLLIGESSNGEEESTLYTVSSKWSLFLAKKRILNEFKRNTGKKHYEIKKESLLILQLNTFRLN
jgi:hypothetical protein